MEWGVYVEYDGHDEGFFWFATRKEAVLKHDELAAKGYLVRLVKCMTR